MFWSYFFFVFEVVQSSFLSYFVFVFHVILFLLCCNPFPIFSIMNCYSFENICFIFQVMLGFFLSYFSFICLSVVGIVCRFFSFILILIFLVFYGNPDFSSFFEFLLRINSLTFWFLCQMFSEDLETLVAAATTI